jgi:hypothetical protein
MDYSLQATYYRTALLLGLVRGDVVHCWAEEAIEREPEPPRELIEVVSVSPTDLSTLRHALWPLVAEPEPLEVLRALFGLLQADLSSGRRGLMDTLTILRQMRSMLRLPAPIYAELNAALVAYAASGRQDGVIVEWLAKFAQCVVDPLQSNRG